ncbi:MAG: hypothetical protein N3D15_08885 [Syntrophorhabdaceae bacterium]|nr:hypothetical protein [Syntrophorhabdaceae bacterium]
MYEYVCKALLENNVRLIYLTNKVLAQTLEKIGGDNGHFHCEVSINEKIAFEYGLAGGISSKRTACIFSPEGIYEALDPIMSSAYTGVIKGLVIICIQDTPKDITHIGLFSKIPVIVEEDYESVSDKIGYAYYISEKYEIPVIIQICPDDEGHWSNKKVTGKDSKAKMANQNTADASRFIKDPNRWAATPSFRYHLHKNLNEKVEKIREEFEVYGGNRMQLKGKSGVITNKKSYLDFYGEDTSLLFLSTIFPLPVKLVDSFIEKMNEVYLIEGEYPAIELQIPDRKSLKAEHIKIPSRIKSHDETISGFEVVRDRLGPASSINIAHGIKKSEPQRHILALTYEDHFLHSGMPAFVNTMYNNSSYGLLIMVNKEEDNIKRFMDGCGFHNYFHLKKVEEIENFKDINKLTVFFCRGIM